MINKKTLQKYCLKFLIFAVLVNISYIAFYIADDKPYDYQFLKLIIWRAMITINAFVFVSAQYFALKKYIEKKINIFPLIISIIVLSFFFFSIHLLVNNMDGYNLLTQFLKNGPSKTDLFIYYFLLYYNIFGAVIYLPDLIAQYITRNDRLQYKIKKNNIIAFQNRLFSQLYIDALQKLKVNPELKQSEKQLILLSDFYRFIVYESETDCIPISKSIFMGNLYWQIVAFVYPHIKLLGKLSPPKSHFNTPTMYILNGLQNIIDIVRNEKWDTQLTLIECSFNKEEGYRYGIKIDTQDEKFKPLIKSLKNSKTLSEILESTNDSERIVYFKSKIANTLHT